MTKLAIFLFITISCFSVAQAQSGGVAILDIDAVARELGVEEKVRDDLLALEERLNQDLRKAKAQLQDQMTKLEQSFGSIPTEEQRRQILATNQQLNAEYEKLKAQAIQALQIERVNLINNFRAKIEPIAKEAAKERGLGVVLMKKMPPVFAYVDEVDITEATAKKAIEAGLKVELTEASAEETEQQAAANQ